MDRRHVLGDGGRFSLISYYMFSFIRYTITWNLNSNSLVLYIDGLIVESKSTEVKIPSGPPKLPVPEDQLILFKDTNKTVSIGNLAIWNKRLDDSEIQQIYNQDGTFSIIFFCISDILFMCDQYNELTRA